MFKKIEFLLKFILVNLFLKIRKIEIVEADTETRKQEVYKLRYEIYKEWGYIDPQDFAEEKMADEYDSHSVNYLALKNNEPIGTTRLVLGEEPKDFPTFKMWNIDPQENPIVLSKTGEVSKLVVKSGVKKKSWVWWKIMQRIYKKSNQLGLKYWVFFTPLGLKNKIENNLKTPVHNIKFLEPKEENLKARENMKGYFDMYEPAPYFLRLEEIYSL